MNFSAFELCRPVVTVGRTIAVRLPDMPPWNSLLLALTTNPQSRIVGSQPGSQDLQWLGKWSAAICNIQQQNRTDCDLRQPTMCAGFRTASLESVHIWILKIWRNYSLDKLFKLFNKQIQTVTGGESYCSAEFAA